MSTMDTDVYDHDNDGIVDAAEGIDIKVVPVGQFNMYTLVSLNSDNKIVPTNWPLPEAVDSILGIVLQDVLNSTPVKVRSVGFVINPGWHFSPGKPVYAHYNGGLTQNPPSKPFAEIGFAINETTLLVNVTRLRIF